MHAHELEKFLPGHCAVRTTQLTFCSLSARPKPSVSIRRYGERHATLLTVARWKTRPLATHTTTRPDASAKAGGGLAHTHRPMRRLLNTTPCCARAASCISLLATVQCAVAAADHNCCNTAFHYTTQHISEPRKRIRRANTSASTHESPRGAFRCSQPQCSAFCSAQRSPCCSAFCEACCTAAPSSGPSSSRRLPRTIPSTSAS